MIENLLSLLHLPPFLVGGCFLFGLLVGSFLNVVIYRLPLILESEWHFNISMILTEALKEKRKIGLPLIDKQMVTEEALTLTEPVKGYRFLATPRSACPNCGHKISSLQNIPLLSWLWLRGRCAGCSSKISVQYPLIELLTGLLSAGVAYRFGATWATAGYLLFVWVIISLTFIDFKHYILPDNLTLPMIWLGLILAYFGVLPIDFSSAFIGAIVGYLFFWVIYWFVLLLFKKRGMGHGDFKLLSLIGAWLGAGAILPVVILSTLIGSIVGIALIAFFKHDRNKPIPFGPYLALGGVVMLLFSEQILPLFPF